MTGHDPSESRVVTECCFLDVGQGTCSIILLGQNRAIVLDCGPRGFTPVRALQHFGIREIVALLVSHNDADHCGGAAQILQTFPKQIAQVYFLEDRPSRKTPLLPLVRRELEAGNLAQQPIRLEATTSAAAALFRSDDPALSLHVLFPWMLANMDARETGGRNRTSAVLALQCGRRRVVFGGDLLIDGWRQIRNGLDAPLTCDLLAVPHHGGDVTGKQSDEQHRWLYREAIRCSTALVSVGTSNQYGHPSPAHMRAIRESSARIICTQVTERCCDDVEHLRPGVRAPSLPGAAMPAESRSASGRSKHVACAGSVLVEIGPDTLQVDHLGEHQCGVDALACDQSSHPLCRASETESKSTA